MLETTNIDNWLELAVFLPKKDSTSILRSLFNDLEISGLGKIPNFTWRGDKGEWNLINLKIYRNKIDAEKIKKLVDMKLSQYTIYYEPIDELIREYKYAFTWINCPEVMPTWTEKNATFLHKLSEILINNEPDTFVIYVNKKQDSTWEHMLCNMKQIWTNQNYIP